MADDLVAAEQTPTSSPSARASSISRSTPSRAGTSPLAAQTQEYVCNLVGFSRGIVGVYPDAWI